MNRRRRHESTPLPTIAATSLSKSVYAIALECSLIATNPPSRLPWEQKEDGHERKPYPRKGFARCRTRARCFIVRPTFSAANLAVGRPKQSEADAELEREIRKGRKVTLAEAIGWMAGPGAMKGVSPVARQQQAAG